MSLTCPRCNLVSPPSAERCDCGYVFRKKAAVRCCLCRAPIDLDDEESYSRANLEYMCRTCVLQPSPGRAAPADRQRAEVSPTDIRRTVEKLHADREGWKKLTGGAIGLFFAISLAILGSASGGVVGSGGPLVAIVVGVIGLSSCIWWLRQYGGDLPDPGTPPYGGMGSGIALLAFIWGLVIVAGVIVAFR